MTKQRMMMFALMLACGSVSALAQTTPGSAPGTQPTGTGSGAGVKAGAAASDTIAKVYVIDMTGKFGQDVSQTPLEQAVKDAQKHQPDVLVVKVDVDWKADEFTNTEISQEKGKFDELFKAEDLEPILKRGIEQDPAWEKKPRLVFWVNRAMGGASFLPLISSEIYFTPGGRMGGIAGLEKIFGSTGDEVVREKQFSLRLGHAEGMAIQGGHDPKLIKAMARTEYVLSVSFEGGKPIYHEDDSGDILLTDDGAEEREDTDAQIVANKGNDCLTLDAAMAYRLGVSRGQAETVEELADALGIGRGYEVIDGKSDKIWKAWGDGLKRAEKDIRRMIGEADNTAVGGDYDERKKARGRQIALLKDAVKLLMRYKEVLDPGEEGISQLNTRIDFLKQEQARDRR